MGQLDASASDTARTDQTVSSSDNLSTPPPAYSESSEPLHQVYQNQWVSQDPRHSSTQSLVPSESGRDGRRTLLLIYIHGFLGTETSFQSFPAHVHNLLSVTLSETHVIHSKIYPRYKSRDDIRVATHAFSEWLIPHESPDTDIILLGHSMGGLLSAEVVLIPARDGAHQKYRHRVLGTVNFDTPFLGMHPGVVVSGLGSLFRPSDPAPPVPKVEHYGQGSADDLGVFSDASTSSLQLSHGDSSSLAPSDMSTLSPFASPSVDPNFNPSFSNDVRIPIRKGWDGAIHFVQKHYREGLAKASANYVTSHLEFGGCMGDYPGLKRRYTYIRGLEDPTLASSTMSSSERPPRVRFINYYTASSGRPKKPKDGETKQETLAPPSPQPEPSRPRSTSPRISISEQTESGEFVTRPLLDTEEEQQSPSKQEEDGAQASAAIQTKDEQDKTTKHENVAQSTEFPDLPAIPPPPAEPPFLDTSKFTDKETRKIAEKDHARTIKAYKQAVKDRNQAIKDREKAIEKRKKRLEREKKQALKAAAGGSGSTTAVATTTPATPAPAPSTSQPAPSSSPSPPPSTANDGGSTTTTKKRDRKFCVTPKKVNGEMDRTWVRVYMDGVDEVGAHCGLFFLSATYEKLVGDVSGRIEEWVKEDGSARVAARAAVVGESEGKN